VAGEVNVGVARSHARAALLLARFLVFEVDAEAAYAWHRLASVAGFAGGASDDLAPRDIAEAAGEVGIDVRDAPSLVDTAKSDRLRPTLRPYRAPPLDDGGAHRLASVRLLPARATADAELLQALVSPRLPGRRSPRALDVAAWLGSDDARAVLHDAHEDA